VWHPKVKSIIESCPFIVFIKGTPENPKCGFTRSLLEILRTKEIEYTFYDIVEDELMRYWTRDYSGWPTFPQVFINGKLIGGLDVTK
jgi:glutaredoxin-related protein